MSTPPDRRSRKRAATRQGISDAATMLFLDRGFDAVTMDEIADAADVGRMTVFNHFPRKEDLFFDRDEEGRALVREALHRGDRDVSPIEALRLLAHRLVAEQNPLIRFSTMSQAYVATIENSETLKARARGIRDELAEVVRVSLTTNADRDPHDPAAHLAAGLLLATWTSALIQAHRTYRSSRNPEEANAVFLAQIDAGTAGVKAAMAGTPYA